MEPALISSRVRADAASSRLVQALTLPADPHSLADELHHDRVAASYDDWERVPWTAHAESWIVPWIVQNAGGGTVVDLGAGTGRISLALAESGTRRVIAVDRSRTMLEVLLTKTEGLPVWAVRADIRELPIADCSVDAVVCSGVLHHVSEPHGAISEISRILRPGGRLVVREPNAAYSAGLFAPIERWLGRFHSSTASRDPTPVDEQAPTESPLVPPELRQWLEDASLVPRVFSSAKFLASLSLPVGIRGEHTFYRLANAVDRAFILRLVGTRGSLLLVVAIRGGDGSDIPDG